MKSIINSLGSNYSCRFVFSSLKSMVYHPNKNLDYVKQYLETEYAGQAHLFYKGRDAIDFSLQVLLEPKSQVLTQAFSCIAVEEGIVRAGMLPVYVDIEKNSTNLSLNTLKQAYKSNLGARAVLVQHSLGIPADIVQISEWCKKNNLVLIEDLAQGVGGKVVVGEEDKNFVTSKLGSFADAVIFSFGRDKILDAVSGGAVVFKNLNSEQKSKLSEIEVAELPFRVVVTDLLYPVITSLIRKTSWLGVGKALFHLSKFFGLLTSPVLSKTTKLTKLHPAYASLVLLQVKELEVQLIHRKQIAETYFIEFSEQLGGKSGVVSGKNKATITQLLISESEIETGSNLRFPIRVKNVNKVLTTLKKNNIHLSDRWYRSAVDCGHFACKTTYKQASCKNAELLASQIINLPTHREITQLDAKRIARIIIKTEL